MGDYFVWAKAIVNKMATLSDDLEKYLVIKKVLRVLFPKWDNVALVIKETKDLSTLEFDELVRSLTSQEERFLRRSNIGTSEEQAFSQNRMTILVEEVKVEAGMIKKEEEALLEGEEEQIIFHMVTKPIV